MESILGFITLFALLLFARTIDARKAPDAYWSEMMKDQPMPDAIGRLIGGTPKGHTKTDCHDAKDKKSFTDDFEPGPNLTAYHCDAETSEEFAKDFEPIPNVSVYHGEAVYKENKESFVKDFEPIPNVSVYHGDAVYNEDKKTFVKDFEPRPNISVYHE